MTNALSELLTKRLRLRWLTESDSDLLLAIWNDPAFVRYVGDRGIRTLDEAAEAFREGPGRLYRDFGYGPYRVASRDTDMAMGICGLFRREGLDDPDIGYALLPQHCGQGYATEAAVAVMHHARHTLGFRRLTALINPENAASIGLVEKQGMSFEKLLRMPGDNSDVSLYGINW
ncbi:MAG: GNAT family N-acetyltransferase [Woeseiaceae bacterium]|nr:GNAT family N-acetyltransferase [Woeseiaceae bacterium]